MGIADSLKVISALVCVAACGSNAAPASDEHSDDHSQTQASTSAGAGGASQPASAGRGNDFPDPGGGPFGGQGGANAASPAASAGASGASTPGSMSAQAGSSGGGAGEAAAGSGGAAGAAEAGSAAPEATEPFSFFVTSLKGMRDLSKSENGFGGDLRYGESTGLAGADKICTELAEQSMPGAGAKGWHAFLSAAKGGMDGSPVHAKDRIGMGPWYDRLGRVVAMNLTDLLKERPSGADPAIIDDLPNERGEPNHTDTEPDMDDNHDVVTGTNPQGMWDGKMTCEDWTSTETPMPMGDDEPMMMGPWGDIPDDGPGLGHSWPSEFSGASWITSHRAPGCGASVALVQTGAGMGTGIGNGGGYGGIYCFALKP
jgi:hypothetical protein